MAEQKATETKEHAAGAGAAVKDAAQHLKQAAIAGAQGVAHAGKRAAEKVQVGYHEALASNAKKAGENADAARLSAADKAEAEAQAAREAQAKAAANK